MHALIKSTWHAQGCPRTAVRVHRSTAGPTWCEDCQRVDPSTAPTLADTRPIATCTPLPQTDSEGRSILDPAFYESGERKRMQRQAWLALQTEQVRSYDALLGQSTKDDYHTMFADLYGMVAVRPGWANGYTDYERLTKLVNGLANRNANAEPEISRRLVVDAWEEHWVTVWTSTPVAQVNHALQCISVALTGHPDHCGYIPPGSWRIEDGKVTRLRPTARQRPAQTRWVDAPARKPEPVWHNPHQVEDAFRILADSPERVLRNAGVLGLSVVRDEHDRLHLVYWQTRRDDNDRFSRKEPLWVETLYQPTSEADALRHLYAVSAAMERTARSGAEHHLTPYEAAYFEGAEVESSAPTVSGGNDWLIRVTDQRLTHARYRSLGAGPDA